MWYRPVRKHFVALCEGVREEAIETRAAQETPGLRSGLLCRLSAPHGSRVRLFIAVLSCRPGVRRVLELSLNAAEKPRNDRNWHPDHGRIELLLRVELGVIHSPELSNGFCVAAHTSPTVCAME